MEWLRLHSCTRASTSSFGRSGRTGLTLLLVMAVVLAGCSGDPTQRAEADPPSRGVPVSASPAVTKAVPVQIGANGSVQALASVTVMSQVDGQVLQIHFTEGQEVRQGDVLFTLDQRPFEATLRQTEANLGRDVAQLRQAEAVLAQSLAAEKQTEANLGRDEAQLDNANAEALRYKSLIDDGAISHEQYDQVLTASRAAEATVQADHAAITSAQAAIGAAQATVENVKAAIEADHAVAENARIQLGYTTIRAPMGGRTGNLLVHVGSSVKARDVASPLVVINQIHPIYISFSVREQSLADVQKYRAAGTLAVDALIPGQEDRPIRGALSFVNNTVDPSTGTIQLKATFPNTDNRLWPGQFLDVVLTLTTEPNAIVVPARAIQTGQQGAFVFVVKPDGTVEDRAVTPGQTMGEDTIVQQGLAAGEQVVTEGQIRLVPGARVEVRPAAPPKAA